MCDKTTKVYVKIPADLSSTGEEKRKWAKIDACIAPIVRALQAARIDMRGSCCGHNEVEGDIHLQDGRILIILDPKHARLYMPHKEKINIKAYIRLKSSI